MRPTARLYAKKAASRSAAVKMTQGGLYFLAESANLLLQKCEEGLKIDSESERLKTCGGGLRSPSYRAMENHIQRKGMNKMNQTQTRSPRKRLLSLILAVILMIGLLPISAFATGDGYELSAGSRFFIVNESDPTGTDLGNYVQLIGQEFAAKGKPSSSVLPIVYGQEKDAEKGDIVVKLDSSLGEQSYKVSVGQKIVVTGGDAAGAFYGLTNLLQMFEKNSLQDVTNTPLVAERSAYIDCGRVYFSPEMLKALIKTLAWNRMNTLYLDFSNNNATRFFLDEMKVTVDGTTYDITKANPGEGQYLTQADMEEIIAVAKQYGVQIIPTFNSPGHIGGLYSLNKSFFDKATATDYDSSCGKVTLLIENKNAYDFGQAVVKLYVDFFAQQGCKSLNIAADEATLGNVNYDSKNETFVKYVNDLNTYIKSKGMTTRMFNDGIQNVTGDGISKDIIVLYWAPESTAEALHKQGYQVVNFSYGAGLYFAYGASWWVWNQPVNTIYDGWTPGVLNRNTDYQYSYVATETTDPSNLLGATFAVWTDYAFTQSVSGDQIINRDSENVVEKIQVVGDRCWSNKSSETYSNWKAGLTTAPGGINVSTYAIDGTVLPAASGITAASQVEIPVEDANTDVSVVVKGEKGQTGSLTVDKLETSPNADAITAAGAEKSVSYNVTPAVDGKAYTGEGTVTLPVPEGWATEASRIRAYIIDNGAVKLISGTLSGGKYTFQVPHFSEMGLVQLAKGAGSTENVTVAVGRTSKAYDLTGDNLPNDGTYPLGDVASYTVTTAASGWKAESKAATTIVTGKQYVIGNGSQYLTLNDGTLGTIDDSSNATVWTITKSSDGYTINSGSYYLSRSSSWSGYSLSASTSQATWSWSANDGFYYSVSDWFGGTTTYYLTYSDGWTVLRQSSARGGGQPYTATVVPGGKTVTFKGLNPGSTSVTLGDTTYSVTVVEKQNVEIPISIIDYRADGLLFDWSYYPKNKGGQYYDSYRYGLVHSYAYNWGIGDGKGVDAYTNADGNLEVSGTADGVEKIEGTLIQRTGNANTSTKFYPNGTDNDWSRAGLVQERLGANGMPVYTDAAVKYVASLLAKGYYNDVSDSQYSCNTLLKETFLTEGKSRSVLTDTAPTDFSENFRNAKTYANISNAYDLAWYLLNTIYQADTNMTTVTGTDKAEHQVPIYGMAVDAYKSIVLTDNGTGTYSFEAGYSGTKKDVQYDRESGTIYNGTNGGDESGFYPLENLGYEQLDLLTNTSRNDSLDKTTGRNRNGSFTLRGESQFVYNKASKLYFTFTGDDDVYMYINGVLALDLGGAHGRNTKTVNLNEVADKCGLVDGQVATFTFFYMERCSDASTFGIKTNMELVQRAINVEKKAYDTSYVNEYASGTAVINGTTVAYDLIVTNKSNSPMSQIKLTDTDSLHSENGSEYGKAELGHDVTTPSVTPSTWNDPEGRGTVALGQGNGYVLFITDSNGAEVKGSSKRLDNLKALSDEIAGLTLPAGQSLHVRFLTAKTEIKESKILDYINTVEVSATVGGQALSDTASHELYSYNAKDTGRTYVVDFGLPLKIEGIFDTGAQGNIGEVSLSPNNVQKYGTVTIAPNGFDTTLTYTRTADKTINEPETITLDVVYKIGNSKIKLEKTLTIIPASNVYYEDSLATFTDGSGAAQNAVWSTVGNDDKAPTEQTDVYQALEELGKHSNVYGHDGAYNSSSMLSMGTAHKVTVTSAMLANWEKNGTTSAWPTAQFTFKGTGFDIISLTDNTSGSIVVDVYKGSKTEGSKPVHSYLVNNYYGYTYNQETQKWEVDKDAGANAIYQIPVMKVNDLPYGEYTAVIEVFYNSFFDMNYDKNSDKNQYSFWLDAIRVYNPMDDYADYTKDNEGYPQYIKLRDTLADGTAKPDGTDKTVFIDGGSTADIMTTYANLGPNNEVYLMKGQAITFKLTGADVDKIASVQIGAKAPKGTAVLNVNGTDIESSLSTATEMYYDITRQVTGGSYQVTITNNTTTTDNILSLTNLKITFKEKPTGEITLAALDTQEQENAVNLVRALFTAPVATFSPETFQADWGRAVRAGKRATLTVKTSADVESITVDGQSITSYTTRTQRTGWGWWSPKVTYHVFTYTITAPAQTTDYAVCAVNAEGTASEAVTATLTVKPTTWWNWWF